MGRKKVGKKRREGEGKGEDKRRQEAGSRTERVKKTLQTKSETTGMNPHHSVLYSLIKTLGTP